jgi:hypothetical protein
LNTILTVLSVVSGLLLTYSFVPYVRAIVRRETSPRKATWLIWASCDWIILLGMLYQGTISGLLVGAVLGATTTLILSIKYGESGWTKRDKICVAIAGTAVATWVYFGESNYGIVLSSLALFVAAWPTYMSAWENPFNEDAKAWKIFTFSSLLGVLAIPHYTFADAAGPWTFLLIDSPMLYLAVWRQFTARNAEGIRAVRADWGLD